MKSKKKLIKNVIFSLSIVGIVMSDNPNVNIIFLIVSVYVGAGLFGQAWSK